ncbi:hypothetical protein F5X98DRAFT_358011 [Xylaria grammica]|nr:hypothetical protein F5X98DRAFT_358011 [Xylaria grammica]
MDPVSLTLAVLPLVGGALKTYGILHKKFKSVRHYSREIHRARKNVDQQRQFFRNEVHLLVRPALEDESILESMLDDFSHEMWCSTKLEDAIKKALKWNYTSCLEIIEEIGTLNTELEEQMRRFDVLEQQQQPGESLKEATRRLRGTIKIAWDSSKFTESVEALRSSNYDLRRLREHISELQQPTIKPQETKRQLSKEYGDCREIQRAANALHLALATAWASSAAPCAAVAPKHSVHLFANAKVRRIVYMDMIISCYGPAIPTQAQIRMTQLKAQSQLLDWIDLGLKSPPSSDDGHQKRRKVRFADDCTVTASTKPTEPPTQSLVTGSINPVNLSGRNLCTAIAQGRAQSPCLLPNNSPPCCLGFLDSCLEETYRHSLYHVTQSDKLDGVISMKQIVARPVEASLSIIDQLKLARSVATAVLKFHSTPWLNPYFVLSDLTFFGAGSDLSKCLQALYFTADFTGNRCSNPNTSSINGIEPSIEHAKLQYGIRNITLWCLGAVLLQIGRWDWLDAPDDVVRVRELSSQAFKLGPRYQQLTKRCLDCDFGYGEDLSKPRLQQAVYDNVVCELSDMIKGLDVNA